MKIQSVSRLKQYSQFESTEEFRTHFAQWLNANRDIFPKRQLIGLKRLALFAAAIPGVTNVTIGAVLTSVNMQHNTNSNVLSRATFKRMTQKTSKLGILTIYEIERSDGSQDGNLYIFNRYPENHQHTN
ncbi:hypothetical protein [Bacillus sp. FJAT-27445]|uniref:hypothetical protein n=1 Tax=Bacillus sp. FJAT-27445 TaxID=1679166 RepID=UPI000743532E|nr:hypothetical protein [Bacillus sp. FJAT-27445]